MMLLPKTLMIGLNTHPCLLPDDCDIMHKCHLIKTYKKGLVVAERWYKTAGNPLTLAKERLYKYIWDALENRYDRIEKTVKWYFEDGTEATGCSQNDLQYPFTDEDGNFNFSWHNRIIRNARRHHLFEDFETLVIQDLITQNSDPNIWKANSQEFLEDALFVPDLMLESDRKKKTNMIEKYLRGYITPLLDYIDGLTFPYATAEKSPGLTYKQSWKDFMNIDYKATIDWT